MNYWKSEIKKWTPGIVLHIQKLNQKANKREKIISSCENFKKIVFITTANMVYKHIDHFANCAKLDILIVDEGHKAKNISTKFRLGIRNLQVQQNKILVTGTPVQNNLSEFYSLLDLVEVNIFGTS